MRKLRSAPASAVIRRWASRLVHALGYVCLIVLGPASSCAERRPAESPGVALKLSLQQALAEHPLLTDLKKVPRFALVVGASD